MPADQPRPLCFALMPFGVKSDASGRRIDFDAIYSEIVVPAIRAVGFDPLRADEDLSSGITHKPMFERLLLCDYAVVDLTAADANVFYELGVRHALRPHTTVLLYAEGRRLPVNGAPFRALRYRLDSEGKPVDSEFHGKLVAALTAARDATPESPAYQLLEGVHAPEVAHAKTDIFREQVHYSESIKERLAVARKQGPDTVAAVESELGELADREAGVVVDLLLSYRSVKAWERMIALTEKMPLPLRSSVMVQEQLGFALNRAGRSEEAEQVLLEVLDKHGASSETCGVLGRVYKDRWESALHDGRQGSAGDILEQAIGAYLKGFEADWRDAYPGMNAVTLMELRQPPDPAAKSCSRWCGMRWSVRSRRANRTTGIIDAPGVGGARPGPESRGSRSARRTGGHSREVGTGDHGAKPSADSRSSRRSRRRLDDD